MLVNSPTAPGIYDLSNEDYHNGPGISRTGIVEFMRSPLHYYERYLNPNRKAPSSKKELEFGNAFHLCLLEPHLFEKKIAVIPDIDKRTTAGKALWAKHQAESFGKIILEDEYFQHLLNMQDRVMSNSTARALIENGQYERSLYYIDEESNHLCKARPDILHKHFIADLKTAKDASIRSFQYDMVEYGYHIQSAMMFDGVEQVLKQKMDEFVFIVVEKLPPYAMAIYPLCSDSIELGRKIYRKKLLELNQCLATNVWPCYESHVVSLPSYILNQAI